MKNTPVSKDSTPLPVSKSAQPQLKSPPEELEEDLDTSHLQARMNLKELSPVSVGLVANILGSNTKTHFFEEHEIDPKVASVLKGNGGIIETTKVTEMVRSAFGVYEVFYPAAFSATQHGGNGGEFLSRKGYHVSKDATVISFDILNNGTVKMWRNVGSINGIKGHRVLQLHARLVS